VFERNRVVFVASRPNEKMEITRFRLAHFVPTPGPNRCGPGSGRAESPPGRSVSAREELPILADNASPKTARGTHFLPGGPMPHGRPPRRAMS
jgi:hypothetical protein